ncbi:MAG: entericidin A/B family lipoprotein [Candidatus Omnitrophota bacterium]|jgi:predicted small secreted protein
MKKIALAVLAIVFLASALTGCNAARGAGKDIQDAGKHVSNIGN